MSYHTYHTYGYGVRTDNIKIKSVDKLQTLISLAPDTEATIKDWLIDNGYEEPTIENYLEYDEEECCHLASILKMVIYELEGIDLTACNDLDLWEDLVFEPAYPWGLTEKDKTITKEHLEEIYRKYLSIITDDVPLLDYQSVENGG